MRLRRKVCLLGASGVGKSSLVRRFVEDRFDEDCGSSTAMAIFKGTLELGDISLEMMFWDPEGNEDRGQYNRSFISACSSARARLFSSSTKPTCSKQERRPHE